MTDDRTTHDDVEDLDVSDQEARDVKGGEGIVSPRDPATGQATGRRSFKPLNVTKELDKSTPIL